MAEEDYTVVKNVRGKADVWRWFGLKKRKTDGHIEQNIAVCFDCGVSVKLALPIFKLTLDDTILSNKLLNLDLNPWLKLKLQLWFINISFFFFFFFLLFFILPCSIVERLTVLICLV